MGKLACGCELSPGAPVSKEMLKAHYEHTLSCLVLWELIMRRGSPQDTIDLAEHRIAILDAITKHFPEID